MEPETSMYKLSGVSKSFSARGKIVEALRNVDLEIPDKSLVSIQGPTGGGKSTLLQLLGGLDRPTKGEIYLAGERIHSLGDSALTNIRAQKIGFVFQGFNLIPTLSALENIEMALEPLRVSPTERRMRSLEALSSVGLAERAAHLPLELSGGEQQRVAIARALVKNPKVLLADEPTGNLDEATRDDIIELLEKLWREKGLTVIIVTHDSVIAKRAQIRLHINKGEVTVRN